MDSSVPLTPLLLRCAPLSASVSRRIPPPQRGCHPQPKRPSIRLESSPGVPTSGFEELKPSSPSHRNQEGNFSFSRIDLREVVDKCGVEPKEGPTPHLHGKPEKPLQGQRGTLVTQRREQGHRRDDLVGGSAVIVPIPSGAEKTLVLPMNDWVDFPPSNVGPDENEWTCTPSTASSSAGSRAAQEDQVEDEVTKPSQSFSSLNGHRHNAPSCDGGEGLSLAAQLDAVNAGDTRPVEQWLDSVCRSASSRGEALLAAQVAKFVVTKAEHKASAEGRWFMQADLSELQPSDRLLRQAVHRGNHPLAARAVQFLVDRKGANVNHRDCWQRTPLHSAAAVGLVDLIRFFLRRGAELDALDQDLRTPVSASELTRPALFAATVLIFSIVNPSSLVQAIDHSTGKGVFG
ncbi:unnamed protein product [Discosporangium mesarthrocarpum]